MIFSIKGLIKVKSRFEIYFEKMLYSSAVDGDEANNADILVNHLVREGIIKHKEVESVMKKIKREYFVRDHDKHQAYWDMPLSIGDKQTISAPHMVFCNYVK